MSKKKEMIYIIVGILLKGIELMSLVMIGIAVVFMLPEIQNNEPGVLFHFWIMAIVLLIAGLGINQLVSRYTNKLISSYWKAKKRSRNK